MKKLLKSLFILTVLFFMGGMPLNAQELSTNNNGMIVRISEIEVYPEYLDEYLIFAKEVAEASVKNEKDVVSIYPMAVIKDNNQIRILEIYRNQEAYKKHIESAHFKKYKEGTLHMVKSLDLVDTYQIAPDNFKRIFKK